MMLSNVSLILDTNSYRYVAHDVSFERCRETAEKWKALDKKHENIAYASPIVIWELISHLANKTDPGYNDCLKALILLHGHTRSENDSYTISAVAHPLVNFCNNLFGKIPREADTTQRVLIELVDTINSNPHNISDETQKRICVMEKRLAVIKRDWSANMISLTKDDSKVDGDKWFTGGKKKTRKLLREFYQSKEFGNMFATVMVLNGAKEAGVDNITEEQLSNLASIVEINYPVVVKFNANFFEKLPSSSRLAFKSKKKKHANNAWDAAICYHISKAYLEGRKTILVTNDKAIHKASADVGLSNHVLKICDYLPDGQMKTLFN